MTPVFKKFRVWHNIYATTVTFKSWALIITLGDFFSCFNIVWCCLRLGLHHSGLTHERQVLYHWAQFRDSRRFSLTVKGRGQRITLFPTWYLSVGNIKRLPPEHKVWRWVRSPRFRVKLGLYYRENLDGWKQNLDRSWGEESLLSKPGVSCVSMIGVSYVNMTRGVLCQQWACSQNHLKSVESRSSNFWLCWWGSEEADRGSRQWSLSVKGNVQEGRKRAGSQAK